MGGWEKAAYIMAAYFLGSIPCAYIVAQSRRGIDIRDYGSGNVGTMNTRLVMGWPAALAVFMLDFLKGFLAWYLGVISGIGGIELLCIAVLGHNFPVWLRFQGGKGLATAFGGLLVGGSWWVVLSFSLGWLLSYPWIRQVDWANIGVVCGTMRFY